MLTVRSPVWHLAPILRMHYCKFDDRAVRERWVQNMLLHRVVKNAFSWERRRIKSNPVGRINQVSLKIKTNRKQCQYAVTY